jgi:hypothetical protein
LYAGATLAIPKTSPFNINFNPAYNLKRKDPPKPNITHSINITNTNQSNKEGGGNQSTQLMLNDVIFTKHVEQAIRSAIKIHLLHLVGILFPHNIDDARSKPHQMHSIDNNKEYCITLHLVDCT